MKLSAAFLTIASLAGANAFTVGPKGGMKYAGKHSYPCVCDRAIDDVTADELDVLIIPGGWAPDYWRRDDRFKKLCVDMDAAGKLIGTICHGPWLLISAKHASSENKLRPCTSPLAGPFVSPVSLALFSAPDVEDEI